VIQRFGSGLRLNVHFHTLVLDGAFNEGRQGLLTFHPAPPPNDDDAAHVVATVRPYRAAVRILCVLSASVVN